MRTVGRYQPDMYKYPQRGSLPVGPQTELQPGLCRVLLPAAQVPSVPLSLKQCSNLLPAQPDLLPLLWPAPLSSLPGQVRGRLCLVLALPWNITLVFC